MKDYLKKVNIKSNNWILKEVINFQKNGIFQNKNLDNYKITSIYDHDKITSLFMNFDTMSFLDLVIDKMNF